ncbi:hypothetical protein [Mesorhizobium sp. M1B.F.Ca.ET.045.04.1.1]|uniref:hypothetical protein n=1 Tax=Mesorhizobium sp. M1B.F.Ca.ET.045.04.1.1 TaxID=2493673 RepID=UPI000F756723|nr:hypothetical protein [Mesorhizobium sp. M1B.F.Ca.ET.045.04.1.1]AZO29386.1 hypothetical protein EJ071_19665 [Mesorhizobium sp. M1B.F.Ca.ET.045.04.1.1]
MTKSKPVAWADLEAPAITTEQDTANAWAKAGRPITPLYATPAQAVAPTEGLPRLLEALAVDCENTDGWEGAAPDLREAATAIMLLSARLVEVELDLADYKAGYEEAAKSDMANAARATTSEAEASDLRRKLEEARKALEPFAALSEELDALRHEDGSTCVWRLKASDIRRARALTSGGLDD